MLQYPGPRLPEEKCLANACFYRFLFYLYFTGIRTVVKLLSHNRVLFSNDLKTILF